MRWTSAASSEQAASSASLRASISIGGDHTVAVAIQPSSGSIARGSPQLRARRFRHHAACMAASTASRRSPVASSTSERSRLRVPSSGKPNGPPSRCQPGNDRGAHAPPLRCLLPRLVRLVRGARDRARGEAGVGLDRDPLRIARGEAGDRHAGAREARRAFEEHQRHRRVHQFDRRMRAGREIGGAMRILAAGRARRAVGVERRAELRAAERRAVRDERRPVRGPAEVVTASRGRPNGKSKPPIHGPGLGEEALERRPVGRSGRPPRAQARRREASARDRDRLSWPRRGGEIHAENRGHSSGGTVRGRRSSPVAT